MTSTDQTGQASGGDAGLVGALAVHGRLAALLAELGIPLNYGVERRLVPYREAMESELVSVGRDIHDREQRLIRPAAAAWEQMKAAAGSDGVELQLVSAFRSVEYQAGIIRRKLARGLGMAEILRSSAAPGFSEHHTGRAIDLTTPGSPELEEGFEVTPAFRWLAKQAGEFGFRMSFPRNNPHGFVYEPWHWHWAGDGDGGGDWKGTVGA